jgi:flagellar biosynthetic protein FliQ
VNDTAVVQIGVQAMILAAKLCAPILLTALAIGFAVSLLQTMTQIQEVTLSFVPKMIGVGIALVVSGSWMLHEIISFTNDLFASLPALLR